MLRRIVELVFPAYVAFSVAVLLWDTFLAGRIARLRSVPRPFAGLTALCGLLLFPALFVYLAAASTLTARTVYSIAWLWPLTIVLFAAQAVYATARQLVVPFLGGPIAVYNVLLAAVAIARYATYAGVALPPPAQALTAAQASAMGLVAGSAALWAPWAVAVPLLSPAYPGRWTISRTVRVTVAAFAAAAAAVTAAELVRGVGAVLSYRGYANAPLQERPAGDFLIGVRLFPDLTSDEGPPPLALRNDVALADSVGARAVMVVVDPAATRGQALDSLARSLDELRRDSVALIVALGYPPDAGRAFRRDREAYTRARLAEVERIARRIRPDYLLPADEPYGRGARALGRLPSRYWTGYIAEASRLVKAVNRRIKVGVSAADYSPADSALYAWAVARGSPVDAVGFAFFPSFRGAVSLEARLAAADRWMFAAGVPQQVQIARRAADSARVVDSTRLADSTAAALAAGTAEVADSTVLAGADTLLAPSPAATPPPAALKLRFPEHWVFAAGGYPLAHGEASQERALWRSLSWATSRPAVRGLIAADAGEYGSLDGLRAPTGRTRRAATAVRRAIRGLAEGRL